MAKVNELLEKMQAFILKAEDDPIEDVPEFPGLEKLGDIIEDYEKAVAKLLRRQRKYFLDEMKSFVSKDGETLAALLVYFQTNLFAADEFTEGMAEESKAFFEMTTDEVATMVMDAVDKDIPYEEASNMTKQWIEEWSEELAALMVLNTNTAIEQVLSNAIDEDLSINQVELRLKDLPEFSRTRARTTAITEMLTAASQGQDEAYRQSPAVSKKRWRHSGKKKNQARDNHVRMDGLEVDTDAEFSIASSSETARYPRDTKLSAKERVRCKCIIQPVVDEDVLGLSVEEREEIRREVMEGK
ncbi:phage minor head protein [Aureibacillus halotolerans]|uniref:Phage Mu protein F like protein n=1 Tax=Aureibacillus halotolerans TaxID=1508390 RepID=A0A4R6TRG9_9BACI|nr:phage minor head protein [Aureibacillus halotolerans]TDQ35272.1 phage Mu protein F like protein [Aureibacillus halotolerans]